MWDQGQCRIHCATRCGPASNAISAENVLAVLQTARFAGSDEGVVRSGDPFCGVLLNGDTTLRSECLASTFSDGRRVPHFLPLICSTSTCAMARKRPAQFGEENRGDHNGHTQRVPERTTGQATRGCGESYWCLRNRVAPDSQRSIDRFLISLLMRSIFRTRHHSPDRYPEPRQTQSWSE